MAKIPCKICRSKGYWTLRPTDAILSGVSFDKADAADTYGEVYAGRLGGTSV